MAKVFMRPAFLSNGKAWCYSKIRESIYERSGDLRSADVYVARIFPAPGGPRVKPRSLGCAGVLAATPGSGSANSARNILASGAGARDELEALGEEFGGRGPADAARIFGE